jgi:hypothetical protein
MADTKITAVHLTHALCEIDSNRSNLHLGHSSRLSGRYSTSALAHSMPLRVEASIP